MFKRAFTLLAIGVLPLALTGCDSDGDGLSNAEEEEYGTDPTVADTDGDGLNDGDEIAAGVDPLVADTDGDGVLDGKEVELGTDPNNADSDADGCTDGEEVDAGSDPGDATDSKYEGDWPCNIERDSLEDPGWSGRAYAGAMMPRLQDVDQYGDVVDLYDFAGHGKKVVVDISGLWCGWCHEVAKLLERVPSALDQYFDGETLASNVENGEVLWVTVIYSGYSSGTKATEADLATWWGMHPNPHVALLLDSEWNVLNFMNPSGFPSMMLLKDDMTIDQYPDNYGYVLQAIEAL